MCRLIHRFTHAFAPTVAEALGKTVSANCFVLSIFMRDRGA